MNTKLLFVLGAPFIVLSPYYYISAGPTWLQLPPTWTSRTTIVNVSAVEISSDVFDAGKIAHITDRWKGKGNGNERRNGKKEGHFKVTWLTLKKNGLKWGFSAPFARTHRRK